MHRFNDGQRVRVACELPSVGGSALVGKVGVVHRKLRRDASAWIRMDDDLPGALREFPVDDPHGRSRDIVLFPDECEPA